ncbi:MAG TPA: phenylalanine--tRNA ligase beta subunit-related protein [Rectinemataceae bacterium]|nr:phenylalanine--tRNA ligase beta subunit-related protein [Rectinemataceae bacterium]
MEQTPRIAFDAQLEPRRFRVGLVWASGLNTVVTTGMPSYIARLMEYVRSKGESHISPERKAAVRDMLRFGSYKPAGRAKPSSEYLLTAALAGEFPLVNGPVDANNAVSLEWGYPASIFDAEKTGLELLVRRGEEGERYIFNASGQEIDLKDLLVVCRPAQGGGAEGGAPWSPCGNPVKDAMATKVFEGARRVVAVVYAPSSESPAEIEACSARFAALLTGECGAESAGYRVY